VLSVVVAVGVLVGELTLLDAHDIRTKQILTEKQAETAERMKKLEDDVRRAALKLGFNVLILPKEQDLHELDLNDLATKDMPEHYVKTLANSRIITVRHLLPVVQEELPWPEMDTTIILVGTRGEVPISHRAPKQAILTAVPPGEMVVGYRLYKNLKLQVGQRVSLLGREFKISKHYPKRGGKDDVSVWIDLAEAQRMLGREGRINAILALSCQCADSDPAMIRAEIEKILPKTQVHEYQSKYITRAEMRSRAKVEHQQALASEKTNRDNLKKTREAFAAMLVPLVLVGCAVWIGLLAFSNVRQRRSEIGVLRALGVRSRSIFALFLGKALVIGLWGACAGYPAGFLVGAVWGEASLTAQAGALFAPGLLLVLLAAPVVSGLASWAPAMAAAGQDPAVVLREE